MSVRQTGTAPSPGGGFDTSRRDKAVRARRRRLAAEQAELLPRVRQALLELREPLGVRSAYIVGPVLRPEFWSETSAIAVAVEGCSSAVLEVMKVVEQPVEQGCRRPDGG